MSACNPPASPSHITFTLSPPPLRRSANVVYPTDSATQHARRHEAHRVRIPRNFTGQAVQSNWGVDVRVHQVPTRAENDTFVFEPRPSAFYGYDDEEIENAIYQQRQARQAIKRELCISISEDENENEKEDIEIQIRRVKRKRKSEADSLMDDNAFLFRDQPFNSTYLYSTYH